MSGSLAYQNPIALVATQLSQSHVPSSEEEVLFQRALHDVCSKATQTNVVRIVDRLRSVQTPDDTIAVFKDWRATNTLWQGSGSDSLLRRASKMSSTFLKFKGIGDGFAQISTIQSILAPIWGVLCASLSIVGGVLETDENLIRVEQELPVWLNHVSSIYVQGHAVEKDLKDAIYNFYKDNVEFSIDVAIILQESSGRSWVSLAIKKLNEELEKYLKRLDLNMKHIDMGLQTENRRDMKAIMSALAHPPIPQQTASTKTLHHVPQMRSHTFVGRQDELKRLKQCLSMASQHSTQYTALFGVGGVGKSQLVLQHIHDMTTTHPSSACSILFVQARNRQTLLADFGIIGEKLALCNSTLSNTHSQTVIERVKEWLGTVSAWLLVFDNVSDSSDLRDFLPRTDNGRILITTRSKQVARKLADSESIIEVEPLSADTDGRALVFRIAADATADIYINARSPIQQRAASEIVKLAGGLPLAIEQVVRNAARMGLRWEKAIDMCKDKARLLEQQNFCTDHELNFSIGAIIRISLESLSKDYIKAVALFRLIVCLETSSVPLDILYEAKDKNIAQHFDRPWTYMLGATEPVKPIPVPASEPVRQSRLLHLKPLKDFRRRLSRSPSEIPRVDSEADVELKEFWRLQRDCLQEVLRDRIYIDSAVDVLVNAGLVKRLDATRIWVHDLFSELTRALMEITSRREYKDNVHMIATMVYLTFPIPDGTLATMDLVLVRLPHLMAVHKLMEDIDMLNGVTVGAELSALMASSLTLARRTTPATTDAPRVDCATIIKYYAQANDGYREACKRVEAVSGVNWQRIVSETMADYEMEDNRKAELVVDRCSREERIGRSAHWRYINSCAKLGTFMIREDQRQDGISYLYTATCWYEKVFGPRHSETTAILDRLQGAHCDLENWEAAYDVAIERIRTYIKPIGIEKCDLLSQIKQPPVHTSPLLTTTHMGMTLACGIGDICMRIPRRTREAVQWRKVALAGSQKFYEDHILGEIMSKVAIAYENDGEPAACAYWMTRSLRADLENTKFEQLYLKGDDDWRKAVNRDCSINQRINMFKEATTDTTNFSPKLNDFISEVASRAELLERLRAEADAEQAEKTRKDDEEFDALMDRLEEFCENYPPAKHTCYDDAMQLFRELGDQYCSPK